LSDNAQLEVIGYQLIVIQILIDRKQNEESQLLSNINEQRLIEF
jgi:hypothetical protein